jgi:RTX calcium-binding nonapeptide repeat (4 copies)
MTNLTGIKESRKVRRARLAASAVVVAAAVAVAGGMAAQGHAASFKTPKLANGLLRIDGTSASERIALRLKNGQPDILQVDVGDDGSAEFEFARADVALIELDARPGDDFVRIDESNGIFTTTIPTTLEGAEGDDTLLGGTGAETMRGGPGDDTIDGNRGSDAAFMGAGEDTFVWDPGDGSDTIEGQAGKDTMLFSGANAS